MIWLKVKKTLSISLRINPDFCHPSAVLLSGKLKQRKIKLGCCTVPQLSHKICAKLIMVTKQCVISSYDLFVLFGCFFEWSLLIKNDTEAAQEKGWHLIGYQVVKLLMEKRHHFYPSWLIWSARLQAFSAELDSLYEFKVVNQPENLVISIPQRNDFIGNQALYLLQFLSPF